MHTIPRECCYPTCSAPPSAKIEEPLCDRHLIKVYREVHAAFLPVERSAPVATYAPPRRNVQKSTPGEVYFLQFGDRIKIGFTTNLHLRLGAIPHDKVLATIPGNQYLEKQLHAKFRHLRVKGEWFSMGGDLLDYIDGAKQAAS